ncbi:MAG: MaoC family dehydratase [Xanthobacteraceae bacterium]
MIDVQNLTAKDLHRFVGEEIGVSEWITVTQDMVTGFATATRDLEWMHVDAERSKRESPYGNTIVQGFLAMSLIIDFFHQMGFVTPDMDYSLNYGADRVRFTAVMITGCRLRGRASLKSIEDRGGGRHLMKLACIVEMEGSDKPAVVMDWITYWFEKN